MITKFQKVTGRLQRALHKRIVLNDSIFTVHDLQDVDSRYQVMNKEHASVHQGVIREIGTKSFENVLEVACGTGWNVPHFHAAQLAYFGLDISETAIAVAALKYPENRYFNMGVGDCSLLRDGSFDVVYNSSMLEHIGFHEDAIREMVRIARHEVYILFFEGLNNAEEHRIEFHPHPESEQSGVNWQTSRSNSSLEKNVFGPKVIMQGHGSEQRKGWYWNNYSKKKILELFQNSPHTVEIWDQSNRSYFQHESVLVIKKH